MGVSGLNALHESMQQGDLFMNESTTKIDQLADSINSRFGPSTLQRGRSKTRGME